jgi:hypothetical protein
MTDDEGAAMRCRLTSPSATILGAAAVLVACGTAPDTEVLAERPSPQAQAPPVQEGDDDGPPDGHDDADREDRDTAPDRSRPAPPDDGDTPWHLLPEDDRPSTEVVEPECDRTSIDLVPC